MATTEAECYLCPLEPPQMMFRYETIKPAVKCAVKQGIQTNFQNVSVNVGIQNSLANSIPKPSGDERIRILRELEALNEQQNSFYKKVLSPNGYKPNRESAYVTNELELTKMLQDLSLCNELALELDHHLIEDRNYILLLQISTKKRNYIVDVEVLRTKMHLLKSILENRNILKIFYKAYSQVKYLQQELALFIVNIMDLEIARQIVSEQNREFGIMNYKVPMLDVIYNNLYNHVRFYFPLKDLIVNVSLKFNKTQSSLLDRIFHESRSICMEIYKDCRSFDQELSEKFSQYNIAAFNDQQKKALKKLSILCTEIARRDMYGKNILSNRQIVDLAERLPIKKKTVKEIIGVYNKLDMKYYMLIISIAKQCKTMVKKTVEMTARKADPVKPSTSSISHVEIVPRKDYTVKPNTSFSDVLKKNPTPCHRTRVKVLREDNDYLRVTNEKSKIQTVDAEEFQSMKECSGQLTSNLWTDYTVELYSYIEHHFKCQKAPKIRDGNNNENNVCEIATRMIVPRVAHKGFKRSSPAEYLKSRKPLDLPENYESYKEQLRTFECPSHQILFSEESSIRQVRSKHRLVRSESELKTIFHKLCNCREIAVDVKCSTRKTYECHVNFILISTRAEDYIIDAVRLRSSLNIFNGIFMNKEILKVFHGCKKKILCLQKDCSLFFINVFDVELAVLAAGIDVRHMQRSFSQYKNILNPNAKIKLHSIDEGPLSKKYLSFHDLLSDTYMILKLKTTLTNCLIENRLTHCLKQLYDKCNELCKRLHRTPILDKYASRVFIDRLICNNEIMRRTVVVNLYKWRDMRARERDVHVERILSNRDLIILAKKIPRKTADIFDCIRKSWVMDGNIRLREIQTVINQAHKVPFKASKLRYPNCGPPTEFYECD